MVIQAIAIPVHVLEVQPIRAVSPVRTGSCIGDLGNHIERQEFNLRDRCNMLKLHAPQVVSNRLLLCLQREVVDQHRAAAEQDVSQINLLEKPVLYLKSGFFGIS